jgi:predicted DNA-binding WGR domain protein|mmetsp:Transcript_52970/g.82582  ORF Transcript_52970/g.82582 Transcript_52970/m.82582 type:complete len:484 (+) Transcript_52970:46-1497(+)
MAPKAKARAEPKAKATSRPEAKAKGRPEPKAKAKAEAKRGAPSVEAPPVKRQKTSELVEKAKAAADRGSSGGRSRNVDQHVPSGWQVYEDYTVKLNQTHVDANNNKFYMIQVLENGGKYASWNRWGRVGEPGQNKLSPFQGNVQAAIKDFEKKFRDKTQNSWSDRSSFKPVNGKYSIVETEDADGGGDSAPMGKLTEAQIGKGQKVLDVLEGELQKKSPNRTQIDKLSSEYYTLVPHNFGRQRPPPIATNDMLQAEVELLKFYLRMGFDTVEEEKSLAPISGVMELPLPATLQDCGVGTSSIASCTKQGEQLAKKQAGNPATKMGAALYASIMMYTSNAIYQDLNKCLRDENRAKIKKYFKYLRLLFEAMGALPKEKRTLWRGISVDLFDSSDYAEGSTVTWWSVTSTTADLNVAKNFTKGCGGKCTLFTIETETSTDISEMSFFGSEKESLLAPGTQLKVLSKKRNGNVAEIKLKEVGRVIA